MTSVKVIESVIVLEEFAMVEILRLFAMICLYCLILVSGAHAQISATLSTKHDNYSGICPTELKFKGTITSEKPGKIQYRFIRSDGTLLPVETLEFSTPGAKDVNGLWIAGEAGTSSYEGWQAIRIVYPEEVESNRVKFKVICDQNMPALTVNLRHCPRTARPSHELGSSFKIKVTNHGKLDLKDVTVDIVLKKDDSCQGSEADTVDSTHFLDGVLLKGGREQVSLNAGQKYWIKLNGTNTIPADTPTGDYYLCAVVNAGDQIKDSNKTNNCSCSPIKITTATDKPDLIIDRISFKVGEECAPNHPVYIFEVTVKNIGSAPSPSLPNKTLVQVMDIGSRWGSGTTLNSLPPGATQTVFIPVYYFSEDPAHMTKVVPHPFRAVVDPFNLIEESNKKNNTSDIIYLDPGLICPK
jgi:subtilase family serine protease